MSKIAVARYKFPVSIKSFQNRTWKCWQEVASSKNTKVQGDLSCTWHMTHNYIDTDILPSPLL